jgi:hypothetical protein
MPISDCALAARPAEGRTRGFLARATFAVLVGLDVPVIALPSMGRGGFTPRGAGSNRGRSGLARWSRRKRPATARGGKIFLAPLRAAFQAPLAFAPPRYPSSATIMEDLHANPRH